MISIKFHSVLCSQQISDLKKENFSLKLRIYYTEERLQQTFGDDKDVLKMVCPFFQIFIYLSMDSHRKVFTWCSINVVNLNDPLVEICSLISKPICYGI